MKKVLTQLATYSFGSLIAALLNFVTVPVITFFISPEEYGKASMFMLLQSLILSLLYLGIDQAYTRFFYEYKEEKRQELLFNALVIPCTFAVITISLMIIFAKPLSFLLFDSSSYTAILYLYVFTFIFLIIERFILMDTRMKGQVMRFSIYQIGIKLGVLFALLVGFLFYQTNFLVVIYAMIIGQFIVDIILVLLNWPMFCFKGCRLNPSLLVALLKYGLPIVIATVFNSIFMALDRFFLKLFSNYAEIGLFTAGFKIASALLIVQVAFSNFWLPTAYRWLEEGGKDSQAFKVVSDLLLFIGAIAIVLMLLFKIPIVWLLSPGYTAVKDIFPFLCLYPLMVALSDTTCLGIAYRKKSHLHIYVALFSLVISVILLICLVPSFGAVGASIATGITYVTAFFLRSYLSAKVWQGFSMRRHILLIVAFCGLMFLNIRIQNIWLISSINISMLILLIIWYAPFLKKVVTMLKQEKFNH